MHLHAQHDFSSIMHRNAYILISLLSISIAKVSKYSQKLKLKVKFNLPDQSNNSKV